MYWSPYVCIFCTCFGVFSITTLQYRFFSSSNSSLCFILILLHIPISCCFIASSFNQITASLNIPFANPFHMGPHHFCMLSIYFRLGPFTFSKPALAIFFPPSFRIVATSCHATNYPYFRLH